ncbi:MAG TPA: MFS transporter [Terriglobales bacterium]|nr:MFS transporter [Terriglobales bacterium]
MAAVFLWAMPSGDPASGQQLSIAARLERLPVGRFHRRFITLVSLGGWFDLYDLFMVAYLGAALQDSHFLSLHQFSLLVSAGFLGMFLGTVLFGMGSDRVGRRSAFVIMLLIYSVFTLAGALAPDANWLIATRFLAGIGIGAEIVVIDTYVTELVPSWTRGRFVAITQVVGFTSVPAVALLCRVLVPTHFWIDGWRWIMVIGAAGGMLAWYFRLQLPESPRWLAERGREREAENILQILEAESGETRDVPNIQDLAPSARENRPSVLAAFAELWRPPYARRTAMLIVFQALQTIGFYGFSNWAPTFLLHRGVSLLSSLDYTLLMALVAPLGPLVATFTSDRWERKWTIAVTALLVALFGLGFAFWTAPTLIVLSGALITLCNNCFSANFHAYQSELFPTRIRATGVGFTYSWSRLSAAFTSLLIGAVLMYGVPAVFALLAAAMVVVAIVILALGPRSNGVPLEELSS